MVYNFLFVHPFNYGNGRIARLILNKELYRFGYMGCIIPANERHMYLSTFDSAFYEHNYQPIYQYLFPRIEQVLETMGNYMTNRTLKTLTV